MGTLSRLEKFKSGVQANKGQKKLICTVELSTPREELELETKGAKYPEDSIAEEQEKKGDKVYGNEND